ncbi:MAG: ankyrin repeat domain-containing protein [Alphaproteobacteria bacterium]|nr:ankyrin repeat domain-containing protein [Alphaproteobacteria bacterium]
MRHRKTYYSPIAITRIEEARNAIRAHDYVALNTMLAQGLNPNIPASDGRYLVHDAVTFDAGGTALDILAHYHADLDAQWANYLNWTPAHIAWYMRRSDIVEKLKNLGADLEIEDARGWSASRALPCPITRKEAELKFSSFANMLGHTHDHAQVFA